MLASLAMIKPLLMRPWVSARRPPEDARASTRMALREAEYGAERLAAKARLAIVVLFGAQIVAASLALGRFNTWIVVIYGLNVAATLVAAVLTRPGLYRVWVPWTLATFDGVTLLIILSGGAVEVLGGAFAPAVTYSWVLFLLLVLTAMRYDARLVIYTSLLFSAVLAWVMLADSGMTTPSDNSFDETMNALHGPGPNTVRLAVFLLTGLILAGMVARGRRSIVEAVEAIRRTENLARQFARPVATLLADTEAAALRQGRRHNAAILFADMRGFTALAEQLDPTSLADFLNEFRRRSTWAIESQGGIVDKFVGDNVMGVFGAIDPGPADAIHALKASQLLLETINRWNEKRQQHGASPVALGISVHYGPVFTGLVGTEECQEFTVIGDVVNTAHRIEELTKELRTSLLVSAQVMEAAGLSPEDAGWMPLPLQSLRGRTEPVRLFTLSFQ
jgi:adenylate cyclase